MLGLLGHNGAGKTTAVRILTTLLRPTEGRAAVAGHDVVADAATVRTQIGLAGQQATVDGLLTARANLEMVGRLYHLPRGRRRARAPTSCSSASSLADAADRLVQTFSGGMRRRLDLAASLMAAPPVLFLDEPTTGLDPRSRIELWDCCASSCATARRCCSPRSTSRRPTAWPTTSSCSTAAASPPRARPAELKARIGGERLEVTVGGADELAAAAAALGALRRRRRRRSTPRPPRVVARAPPASRWPRSCARSTPPASPPPTCTAARRRSTTSSSPSPTTPTTEEVAA